MLLDSATLMFKDQIQISTRNHFSIRHAGDGMHLSLDRDNTNDRNKFKVKILELIKQLYHH